ncbi:MAG TPA: hypothetical protein VJJ79_03000 [Candidatus Nanoarchaeia archaeon]|nr:hypothetical protein [Candidatus Woesearchaeota archaeon]HLC22716.1 hypothetical protein [Candidatus Nanoarchaeia archaeon]
MVNRKIIVVFFAILVIVLIAGCRKRISTPVGPGEVVEEKTVENITSEEVVEEPTAADILKGDTEIDEEGKVVKSSATYAVLTGEKPKRISLWEGTGFVDEHGNDTKSKAKFRRTLKDVELPECQYLCGGD